MSKPKFTLVDKEDGNSGPDEENALNQPGDGSLDRISEENEDVHEEVAEKSEESSTSQLIPERTSTDPDSSESSSDSEEELICKRERQPK